MKQMTTTAMVESNGGASKYVYCPLCGYKKKNSLWERFRYSNKKLEAGLNARHYTTANFIKYGGAATQAVHY